MISRLERTLDALPISNLSFVKKKIGFSRANAVMLANLPSFANSEDIHCGVPQGSCLGQLLYSILTNDLPSVMNKASVLIYADDSTK
jgi:hypothetical protein